MLNQDSSVELVAGGPPSHIKNNLGGVNRIPLSISKKEYILRCAGFRPDNNEYSSFCRGSTCNTNGWPVTIKHKKTRPKGPGFLCLVAGARYILYSKHQILSNRTIFVSLLSFQYSGFYRSSNYRV